MNLLPYVSQKSKFPIYVIFCIFEFCSVQFGQTLNKDEGRKIVTQKDEWIFEATACHLAAEYKPGNLQLILSSLENKKTLLDRLHEKGKISPLHIASNNVDPSSTK